MISLKKLAERGDTVVEVLISIAVVSFILGGAFVLTNRSLQGTRQAQERLNGIKLVESQLEQLKNLAATNSSAIFGSAPPSFCINQAGAVVVSSLNPSGVASNTSCRVGVDGNPTTNEPVFNLNVSRTANTFTVKSVWNNTQGGQDNVEMKYKLYE